MIAKIIEYLVNNPEILKLFQEHKLSLIGLKYEEEQAVLEAFQTITIPSAGYWA